MLITIFLPISTFAQIERGFNYDRELLTVNEDGSKTYKWTSHPERLVDYYWNNKPVYADFLLTNDANYILIETQHGSVSLDKNTCGFSFFKKGIVNEGDIPLFTDSIIARIADDGTDNWNNIKQINDATCQAFWNGSELIAKKEVIGVGLLEYKYINTDEAWKTQLEATNLSSLTNKKFGFIQTIDLNRDTIKFGGSQRNLDNFNNTTFDRIWLENNESKVIDFLNDITFNFDLGFNNLWAVTVYDTGINSSKLSFDYSKDAIILLPDQTLIIDPTFSQTASTDFYLTEDGNNDICDDQTYVVRNNADLLIMGKLPSSSVFDCRLGLFEFDISSIGVGMIVSDADFSYDIAVIFGPVHNSDIISSQDTRPSTATDAQIGANCFTDTVLVNNTAAFSTTGDNQTVDLESIAETEIETAINAGDSYYAFCVVPNDKILDGGNRWAELDTVGGTPSPTLTIVYAKLIPNAVDDLVITSTSFTTADLSWSQPNLHTGSLTGYQINSTTPFGDPLTIQINNTNSNSTTTTILDLELASKYSFRVSAWTEGGNNATGNIANATTLGESFTVGQISVTQTNPDLIDIRFQRTEINSTSTRVDVLYSNSYNLTCTVDHRFARTNQNYSNLDVVTFDSSTSNSSFFFNDHTNDLVNMYCFNENDITNDGRFQITWTSFPMLDQFTAFRSGDYGTDGRIGVIDFITLAVIIFSMIGLNRINESVGVIFNIILLGALAYFQIIELPTIIFGALTIVLVFTIASTRKK